MAHIDYLKNITEQHNNLSKKIKELLLFLTNGDTDKSVILYYYGNYNRLYSLTLFCFSGYIKEKHSVYIDNKPAILKETKQGFHLNESYFFPNCSDILYEALSNLEKSYFYKAIDFEWKSVAEVPECFKKYSEGEFFVKNNIDTMPQFEIISILKTIKNTTSPIKRKLFIEKLEKIFI